MKEALHLTCDLGNGRTKLVLWEAESSRPRMRLVFETAGPPAAAELQATFEREGLDLPAAIHVCSVAGDAALTRWTEQALRLEGAELRLAPDHGLEIECRNEHTIGRDRLFAARGAAAVFRESCVVLDAGTALTVDAVRVEGEASPARFLGGAIAPGPDLLAKSLADAGAQLWEVPLEPGAPALGRESSEAMRAGCVVGFRGAAFELARRVGLEAGMAGARRVLCGGAARYLLEPDSFWPGELAHEPDLVHLGLLAAAGLAVSRTGGP